MFRTFTWLLHWNILQDTYVRVHSSEWWANPWLTSFAALGLPKFFKMIKASTDLFCSRHVRIQKHTCVCPQQQLVGQPSTLGCSPPLASATHVCVCVRVLTAAIGLPKLLNVQNLHSASSLDYSATHMCMFTQQQLVGQPSVEFFCNTCVYVLTATNGLPKCLI